jgi:hypothetical protein
MTRACTRRSMFAALVALILFPALPEAQNSALAQGPVVMQAQGPAVVATQQQFQVTLVQNNLALGGTFMFATDTANADGTTSGTFAANVEGQLLVGRFVALDSGLESLWVAQASGGQFGLVARGWKTPERLVGQTSVTIAGGAPLFGDTFFVVGQGVLMQAAVPAQPAPITPSAQSLFARP